MKIGLETHVQLLTKSKLFCGCMNQFSDRPNTLVCDYDLGLPGSKPCLNKVAIEYAIKIGLALSCKFPKKTFFSRKSYFYPDMGKNFQITQYEVPIAQSGFVTISSGGESKKIRIRRIQLEEDPARIVHIGGIAHAQYSLMDYNRSGVPLCEIVTEPDISSPEEARAYLDELSAILQYLGVYDPGVEGSMRIDTNVSISKTRVEVKNVTGFKDVERAINYEVIRQRNLIRRGQKIKMETRAWDNGVTKSLRSKEEEDDYGYILEPDIPGVVLSKNNISSIKNSIPEMPSEKIKRYTKMKIPREIAAAIISDSHLANSFEQVSKEVDVQVAAKWFAGEIKKTLNFHNMRINGTELTVERLIKLIKAVQNKSITDRSAELLLREMVFRPIDPDQQVTRAARIYDKSMLEPLVVEVLTENPTAIVDFSSGKKEAFHFLVGQVMRKTQGRGDAETIRMLLRKRLE